MSTMNRVFLMGRLTDTPTFGLSKNNRPYARMRIATDRHWVNSDGVTQTLTDWHMVFVWGRLAKYCTDHLRKNSDVFVAGNLTYWREGIDKLGKSAIQAEQVHLLGTRAVDIPEASRNHEPVAQLA